MAANTSLTPLERAGDLWCQSIWPMMRSGARDPNMVAEILQRIKDRESPLPAAQQKPAGTVPIFTLEDLARYFRDFHRRTDIEAEFAKMRWPSERLGFGWLVPVPKGIVASGVLVVLKQKQGVEVCNNYGDVDAGHYDRTAARRGYAVRFRNRVEADEEWKEKSADDLKKLKVVGTTLTERLLLESIFVATTGNHLDIVNMTYCTGSRHLDGGVPGVDWYGGWLYVYWRYSSHAHGYLRVREAVSVP